MRCKWRGVQGKHIHLHDDTHVWKLSCMYDVHMYYDHSPHSTNIRSTEWWQANLFVLINFTEINKSKYYNTTEYYIILSTLYRDIICIEQHKNKHNYFIRVSFIILIKFTRQILYTYTHNVNVVSYLLCVYLHYNLPRIAACNGSRLLLLCFIRIWCLACWIINV